MANSTYLWNVHMKKLEVLQFEFSYATRIARSQCRSLLFDLG